MSSSAGHPASGAAPSADSEEFPYSQPYAWGVDGGSGMPYYFSSGYGYPSSPNRPHHHRDGFGRPGRGAPMPARPAFTGASPARATHGRLPMAQ